MEHLSNILKAMYAHQDGDEILKQARILRVKDKTIQDDKEPRFLYKNTLESTIVNLLQKANIYNTIDQKLIIANVFQSKWSQPDYSIQSVNFTEHSTVFNALLHFAIENLDIKDNDPICKYHRLLRWHLLTSLLGEDIFTTSYLAATDCVLNYERHFFGWDAVLGHDNKEINYILSKPIADVHMHLKGSSFNFDISWISIMNNFLDLQGKFEELTLQYKDSIDWDPDIFYKIRRAAIIRFFLAASVNLIDDSLSHAELDIILNHDINENEKQNFTLPDYGSIQNKIHKINNELITTYGNRLVIPYEYIPIIRNTDSRGEIKISNILSSERKLLYLCFSKIFKECSNIDIFATLFYAYLSYKSYFRQLILQLNDQVGFKNFAKYEERKDFFILPKYTNLLYKASICNFLEHSENRFLETRITPKETPQDISDSIQKILDSFKSHTQYKSVTDRLGIILHFIKSRDNKDGDGFRHKELLKQIKKQSIAISKFRSDPFDWDKDPLVGLIVGIDAANSEITCRPEVFGQAYRFLRSFYSKRWSDFKHPNDLNFTFHVGEDFLDIADGLRAVEEAIIFLGLKHGDRIGHGLVLGTDIAKYYEKRYFTVCASKQVLLDNAAWLHHKCQRLNGSLGLMEYFECVFQKYFNEVYSNINAKNRKSYYDFLEDRTPVSHSKKDRKDFYNIIRELNNINDYYLSWLLRGNHPSFGSDIPNKDMVNDDIEKQWIESSINHHPGAKMALYNMNARELFDAYHRTEVIKQGDEGDTLSIPVPLRKDFINLLNAIQEQLLSKLEKKRIGIECNPTSNYKIGEIERYDQHPIFKFYNAGLNTPYKRHDLFVSINTDDLGVFSTSLDREYSLMALAAERAFCKDELNTPKQVLEWLNNIREMSIQQLFINQNNKFN